MPDPTFRSTAPSAELTYRHSQGDRHITVLQRILRGRPTFTPRVHALRPLSDGIAR
jgi:hypothetical protein